MRKKHPREKEIRGQMNRATRKFDQFKSIRATGNRGKYWCEVLWKLHRLWNKHRDKL